MPAPIRIFQPPADNELTGGFLYNARMIRAIDGAAVRSVPPAELAAAVATARSERAHALVDSLYIGDQVEPAALARAHDFVALVHHLPSLDPGFPSRERDAQARREQRFVRAASRVVVTSEYMRALLASLGVSAPILACPPGVDDVFFAAEDEDPGEPPEVVTVANLEPRKGYLELVPALASLARAHAFRWHIIGDERADADYARRVRAAVAAAGLADRVSWHGRLARPQLVDRLRRARAHVLPTRFETYGMVVAESLAAGVPVIAPRIGEIQNLVRDGETGLLTEPGAPDALARALASLLDDVDLRARMRGALRRRRRELPRWTDAARALAAGLEATST